MYIDGNHHYTMKLNSCQKALENLDSKNGDMGQEILEVMAEIAEMVELVKSL